MDCRVSSVILLISLLFLSLYLQPIQLFCEYQYQDLILTLQESAQNNQENYMQIVQKISDISSSPGKRHISKCVNLHDIVDFNPCIKQKPWKAALKNLNNNLRSILKSSENFTGSTDIIEDIENILKIQNYYPETPIPFTSTDFAKKLFNFDLQTKSDFYTTKNYIEKVVHFLDDYLNRVNGKIHTPEMTNFLKSRDESKDAIFFTETSGTGNIKSRFVCSIESAARAYPNADIYVLIAYMPPYGLLKLNNEALISVLDHYKNVQVLRVDFDALFVGSPVEKLYRSNILYSSKYLAAHTSDIIRILAVWNYGGMYFDMDIITIRNLTGIDHFIIQQSNFPVDNNAVANGAFAFRKHHPVGLWMLNYLNKIFDTEDWQNNGPVVLTYAMYNYTGSPTTKGMNKSNLKEFVKLKYDTLFPINFDELMLYFDEMHSDTTMARIKGTKGLWGVHIGNNIIKNEVVKVGSKMPYGRLADMYCPRAYWSSYATF